MHRISGLSYVFKLLSSLILSPLVLSQFLSSPSNLTTIKGASNITIRFKQVPAGICELNPNVKSFAGYADVAPNQHIFFWFFEARNANPMSAPLTVRLDGGPGASSMNGLFVENGPCTIDKNGNVVNNPFSWSNMSNMLYIDQPTQVGFSYSIPIPAFTDPTTSRIVPLPNQTCPGDPAKLMCGTYSSPDVTLTANTTAAAAPNFYKTLQGFMGAFPQYSKGDFHLTTHSYGGHYGPIFSSYIQEQNSKNVSGAVPIKLKTLLIGNGFYDAQVQYPAYYNFTVSPGNTYDFSPFNTSLQAKLFNNIYGKGGCLDQNKQCNTSKSDAICSAADVFCVSNVESFFDENLSRNEDDIREVNPDPFPPTFYYQYLNTPKVQSALGAFTNWSAASSTVFIAFNSTGDESRDGQSVIIPAMAKLLQNNVTISMYHGDADYDSNWIGGEVVAGLVNAPNFTQAGYVNISTSDGIVHGQVKQAGGFSFSRIYFAGHEAPFYQPLAMLELMARAVNGRDIATGKTIANLKNSKVVTQGSARSTFRNGNGAIHTQAVPAGVSYNASINGPNRMVMNPIMKAVMKGAVPIKRKSVRIPLKMNIGGGSP